MSKLIFVLIFAASPLYLLNAFLMPAINDLAKTYSTLDQTAEQIANNSK